VSRPIYDAVVTKLLTIGDLLNALPTGGEVVRKLFVRLTPPLDRFWFSERHPHVVGCTPLMDEGAAQESLRWHMHRRPKLRIEKARD